MDIETVKKKRQLNVQEQNTLVRHQIYQQAIYWRVNGIPIGLRLALEDRSHFRAKPELNQC